MKAKKKRGAEVPLKVRTFTDLVVNTPKENLGEVLSTFNWEYEKGDFYHWVDLLNHFDGFFDQVVKQRQDLKLDGQFEEADGPLFRDGVLQVLRVTRIILDNCVNKHLYNSMEHVSFLLASTDVEVVKAALEVLASFVKKPFLTRSGRWHGDPALSGKLFSLSQGWGGKEEGLGLLACAIDSAMDSNAKELGSALHFEFYSTSEGAVGEDTNIGSRSGLQVIHVPNVHLLPGRDLEILKGLVEEFKVPNNLRFSLLTRLRFARGFSYLEQRREYIKVRLLAFTVLLQSNPDQEDLTAFFVNEPEFVNELVMLLRAEDMVPEEIRSLAILALAALSQDRPRQTNVLSIIGAGGHRGILPSLMQKAITSLTSGAPGGCTVSFVEALLALVAALVNTSSGCASLREAGLIPVLLPLLKDLNPEHSYLISLSVHILEIFMDFSNSAATLFRELGGLDSTIERLKLEVSIVEEAIKSKEGQAHGSRAVAGNSDRGKEPMVEDVKGKSPMEQDIVSVQGQPGTVQDADPISYSRKGLIKSLLRATALANYAHGNTTRIQGAQETVLPGCLCIIFLHAKIFGGSVFSLAAQVMSGLVHFDPTCYAQLDAAGLPKAFLDSIANGVIPQAEAIACIPSAIIALCLHTLGLQLVKEQNALACFVPIFTSKEYQRALNGETPGSIGAGLDELMRHVPSLRDSGISTCITILKTIAAIGGAPEPAATESVEKEQEVDSADMKDSSTSGQPEASADAPVPMETETEDVEQQQGQSVSIPGDRAGPSDEAVVSKPAPPDLTDAYVEAFLPECISSTVNLLESMLSNSEHSRLFIEQKGIEALLKLYTLPKLPVTFSGSPAAHSMSMTFRTFSPQHSGVLNRAVCRGLREQMTLTAGLVRGVLAGKILSELDEDSRNSLVKSLNAAECFLSLSSIMVRSSTAMMTEVAGIAPQLFGDIGTVYKEVLWQLAVSNQAKVEAKPETEISPSAETREVESSREMAQLMQFMDGWGTNGAPPGRDHMGFPHDPAAVIHARQVTRAATLQRPSRAHMPGERGLNLARQMVARHVEAPQADVESVPGSSEAAQAEPAKGKSTAVLNQDVLNRLATAVRMLFVALGKSMVVPSRRRDDVGSLTLPAKTVAGSLAKLFSHCLVLDEQAESSSAQASGADNVTSLKVRYLGKIANDMYAMLFDTQRRTCNTALLNSFYGHGTFKLFLGSFNFTSQLLWSPTQQLAVGSPMETEGSKAEGEEGKTKEKAEVGTPWLNDTLRCYCRLLEQLVVAPILLTPAASGQLLVQPVPGGVESIPAEPEALVKQIQSEVLDVILPLWRNPRISDCNPTIITAVATCMTNIYTGTGDSRETPIRAMVARAPEAVAAAARPPLPPLDETSINMIVEMGFSRVRAEEALRRVGTNSVEVAMEWLFSHPEEPVPEDDDLAQALALSMGNAGVAAKVQETEQANEEEPRVEEAEEQKQEPPMEEILETAMNLLEQTEAVAFPLTDLILTLCSRNSGEDRGRVLGFLSKRLHGDKLTDLKSRSYTSVLSTIAHILALICCEDSAARAMMSETWLISFALDLLEQFVNKPDLFVDVEPGKPLEVPKWVTALLLVLDCLSQFRATPPAPPDAQATPASPAAGTQPAEQASQPPQAASAAEGATPGAGTSSEPGVQDAVEQAQTSQAGEEAGAADAAKEPSAGPGEKEKMEEEAEEKDSLADFMVRYSGYLSEEEQARAILVCVALLKRPLPAPAMQAVVQLAARLTKRHSIALQFLEHGGLSALLNPTKASLFPSFDIIAASVVRHILEDPQTLQSAMESEIKHTLSFMLGRQTTRVVTPGSFLTAMGPLISRQPMIFMQAVANVCQVERVNGRQSVVLLKDKEKEREKEKEKERERAKEVKAGHHASTSAVGDAAGSSEGAARAQEVHKPPEVLTGSRSGRHKKVPSTFAHVIDQLLEVVLLYPMVDQEAGEGGDRETASAMEVDEVGLKDATLNPGSETGRLKRARSPGKDGGGIDDGKAEAAIELVRVSFVLRLLTEILLMYSSASPVVLRRDTDCVQAGRTGPDGSQGGLIHHIFQRLLPHAGERLIDRSRPLEQRPVERLADKAAYFLMALCLRSGEGRRRVVSEMAKALREAALVPGGGASSSAAAVMAPSRKCRALVELANSLMSTPPNASSTQPPGVFTEMAQAMLEAGLVGALTQTLQSIDLDHPSAPKLVNSVLKALEALTRVSNAVEPPPGSAGGAQRRHAERDASHVRPYHRGPRREASPGGGASVALQGEAAREQQQGAGGEPVPGANEDAQRGGEEAHEEDAMEHDHRTDEEEEDEQARRDLETFLEFDRMERDEGQHHHDDDEEEDMDGEEGEEDEEDDEEEDDEDDGEEDVPASPPDTDGEDQEDEEHGLGEEYDEEDIIDEDDEDDEDWDDQRLIEMRWPEGQPGLEGVQLLAGGAGLGGLADLPSGFMQRGPGAGDPIYMNLEGIVNTFRRGVGTERRRAPLFRAFGGQATRQPQGGVFNHPLLARPPIPGAGDAIGNGVPLPGAVAGIMGRMEVEELFNRGDMPHFMYYDHPSLQEQLGDDPYIARFATGPSQLLDFADDPLSMYMWRSGRVDGRMSVWTDDGLPQSGSHAALVAQAIEGPFIARMEPPAPPPEDNAVHPAGQQPDQALPNAAPSAAVGRQEPGPGSAEAAVPAEAAVEGERSGLPRGRQVDPEAGPGEGLVSGQRPVAALAEGGDQAVSGPGSAQPGQAAGEVDVHGRNGAGPSEAAQPQVSGEMTDTPMQETRPERNERNETAGRDMEVVSQDSGGSAATIGESLRSLEVEIGSVEGHDEGERSSGQERSGGQDVQMGVAGEAGTGVESGRADRQDRDEEMRDPGESQRGGNREPGQVPGGHSDAAAPPPAERTDGQPSDAPPGTSTEQGHQGEAAGGADRPTSMSAAAEIDPTFLEALPEELRAEVLASQQTQAARTASTQPAQPEDIGELDPEFLAALPPDIRAEVLMQQRTQRVLAAQVADEGQPVDMDSASIIATFPAELREEVLLTSSDAVLAALPPALLAEAQLLRERAMNQYRAQGLYGGHRLGGHHRRAHVGVGAAAGAPAGGAGIDPRTGGARARGYTAYQLGSGAGPSGPSAGAGGSKVESEGKPLVDTDALKALLRLLRLAQPLGKGILQRLLVNLCTHSVTRTRLLQLLLGILRPEAEGVSPGPSSADGAPPQRLYGCQWNVVYARPQASDGVPPLVSRRILEILTYLARHHNQVAHQLLALEKADAAQTLSPKAKDKGKGKMVEGAAGQEKGGSKPQTEVPLVLFLKLLSQPLYSRSSAHLEQVMGLMEVVTRNAGVEALEFRNRLKAAAAAKAAEVASAAAAAAATAAAAARATSPPSPTAEVPPDNSCQQMSEGGAGEGSTKGESQALPAGPAVPRESAEEAGGTGGQVPEAPTETGGTAGQAPGAPMETGGRSGQAPVSPMETAGTPEQAPEAPMETGGTAGQAPETPMETGGTAGQAPEAPVATGGTAGEVPLNETSGGAGSSKAHAPEPEELPAALKVLMALPQTELRNLCCLLAREGLSDAAYTRVSAVLKLLADAVATHRGLFVAELAEAARQLSGPAISELHLLGEDDTVVNTNSMAGAGTLRVLQALSASIAAPLTPLPDKEADAADEKEAGLAVARELNVALGPLWLGLSECAAKFEARLGNSASFTGATAAQTAAGGAVGAAVTPLPPGVQKLLPFVEAFFVLCDKMKASQADMDSGEEGGKPYQQSLSLTSAAGPSSVSVDVASSSSQQPGAALPRSESASDSGIMTLTKFSENHRRLLNAFLRQNATLLETSFSHLLRTPRLLDFDNKRTYFRGRIRQQHDQPHYGTLRISVRRPYVLEDSYNQLRMRTPEELKGRLTVQFQGEEGIDAGGLTREWYQLLSRVLFDKGALLFTTVSNDSTYQPNPNSVLQPEHLSYFKFVGRVVAKALYDGQLLDVHFTRSFYKHILGSKVTYHDIEAIDPDYYKNLKWMLENDVSEILDLTFSMDADEEKHILYEKGEVTDYELIPGGRNMRVTEENKQEYVNLVAEYRMTVAIRPQINAFLEGFNELIHKDLVAIFNDKELELLISGLPDIDIDNLRANTEYTGYTIASPVVGWFWEVAGSFSKEDRARLLQFITGTSKVPLEGFKALQGISGPQRFQIHKAYGAPDRLPSAHTCFNQLDLPEYMTKEQLQNRLLLAIHEGSEGFGFG